MDDIIEELHDVMQTSNDIDTIANAMIQDQITYEEATNALIGISCLNKIRVSRLLDCIKQVLNINDYDDFPDEYQETSEK